MNKTFFLALMLASGMALAQSSGSSGSMDQSQPSSQQSQPSTQQSQPSMPQNQPSSSAQNPSSSGQNTMTGCLKGSDGAWVLVAQGQSTPVKGDSSALAPHNGHQVQLKGQQASDGSFQVTDVVMIAESCPTQQSDASSGAGGTVGGAAQQSVRYITDQNPQSSTSSDQKSNPSAQTSNPSGQTSNPSGTQTTNPSGQSTTSPTGGQTSTGGQTTPGQGGKLPQTASPLPLLGLLGLGSLASGLIARRRK